MARLPRINLPFFTQHVLLRGNNRGTCFFHENDFRLFLNKLLELSKKYKVQVHSYALLPNKVQMLLTPEDIIGISRLIQSLGRIYVRYINTTYKRTGSLWEGRYKSVLIDSDNYLLLISRYIELNAVRAKLVKHPKHYKWSSYHYNALGVNDDVMTPHQTCYQSLGKSKKLRQKAYLDLFKVDIEKSILDNIRYSINKSWIMGDDKFKKKIEDLSGHRTAPIQKGGDRKSKKYFENMWKIL